MHMLDVGGRVDRFTAPAPSDGGALPSPPRTGAGLSAAAAQASAAARPPQTGSWTTGSQSAARAGVSGDVPGPRAGKDEPAALDSGARAADSPAPADAPGGFPAPSRANGSSDGLMMRPAHSTSGGGCQASGATTVLIKTGLQASGAPGRQDCGSTGAPSVAVDSEASGRRVSDAFAAPDVTSPAATPATRSALASAGFQDSPGAGSASPEDTAFLPPAGRTTEAGRGPGAPQRGGPPLQAASATAGGALRGAGEGPAGLVGSGAAVAVTASPRSEPRGAGSNDSPASGSAGSDSGSPTVESPAGSAAPHPAAEAAAVERMPSANGTSATVSARAGCPDSSAGPAAAEPRTSGILPTRGAHGEGPRPGTSGGSSGSPKQSRPAPSAGPAGDDVASGSVWTWCCACLGSGGSAGAAEPGAGGPWARSPQSTMSSGRVASSARLVDDSPANAGGARQSPPRLGQAGAAAAGGAQAPPLRVVVSSGLGGRAAAGASAAPETGRSSPDAVELA